MLLFSDNLIENVRFVNGACDTLIRIANRELGLENIANQQTVYIFSAHRTRDCQIYLSPHIADVESLFELITEELGFDAQIGALPNPPGQNIWLGLRRDVVSNNKRRALGAILFTWFHVNNFINYDL